MNRSVVLTRVNRDESNQHMTNSPVNLTHSHTDVLSSSILHFSLSSHNHGCIIESGYSQFRGPPFIPMKAAQWSMKAKMTDLRGLKIPGCSAISALCFCNMDV